MKKLGFEVASTQGYTCYGIGAALSRITKAILFDEKVTLPVSTYIKDLDVFISTPSVISKIGVEENMKVSLNKEETIKLMDSVYVIKKAISQIQ
ncbi:L-lactate dehydrogenase 1 [compost metagenome]